MANQPITRALLKRQFLGGDLSETDFHQQLALIIRYRGYHTKPGQNPKWSGPFHLKEEEADRDNEPWFNQGIPVGIYTEQR